RGRLAGVRVVDLTLARSGPTCTRQLADLGADVIRVVDPRRADLGGSDGANLLRGKRSVALDLRHPDGLAAFLALADRADVLVENFRPAVKHRLGIGPEVCCTRNPRLVYASISGFGQTGPYAARGGLDQIAQGMGGVMSVTGPPGTGPWRTGIAISDTASGTFLAQGVLAALFARERSGRGQWVHTSLLEAMVNFMDFQACRWLTDGEVPLQQGNDHPTFFPMGTYRCADGYVNIAGLKAVDAFLGALGIADLLHDERFATPTARAEHRAEFNAACEAALATLGVEECVERLTALDIPVGPVHSVDRVFADPQVLHLDLVDRRPGADGTEVALLRHPVTLTETPTAIRLGPRPEGADTREVLAELGYDDATVDALVAAGVAGPRDPTAGFLS
ncbi:MAG: CaiB/BaiF CoA-transferase family protein, partial [Actinomycetes bacterium]